MDLHEVRRDKSKARRPQPHRSGRQVCDVPHKASGDRGRPPGALAGCIALVSRTDVTTPEALPEEQTAEASLRPDRLSEFVGQAGLKENLAIAIEAARKRGEPLDHILFFGPPGLGKTTLAMLIAKEMGVNVRTTSGPVLEKAGDLVGFLTTLQRGDVLFIDEIHRLRPVLEEFLYPAMEDFRVDVRIADGPNAQTIPMTIEPFTLVGASTRYGMLTPPMRARFGMVERLGYYPTEDLHEIVVRSAAVLEVAIDRDGADEVAKRSRGTPRVANRLLRRVRDFAQVRADGVITREVANAALSRLNVDEYGLDDMDGRILRTIIEKYDGGPTGLNTLAAAVGEDAETVEAVYEPYLIQQGFLEHTSRGRIATPAAFRHFGFTIPKHRNERPASFFRDESGG